MTSPKEKLETLKPKLLDDKKLFDSVADEFADLEEDRLLGPNSELEYKRMIKELKQSTTDKDDTDER